jgi:hypothetical protein
VREYGGDHNPAKPKKYDKMAGYHKRVVTAEYGTLGFGRPPCWRHFIGWHAYQVAPYQEISAVENESDITGVDEEDKKGKVDNEK